MSDKGVLQFSSAQPRPQGEAPAASKAILVPSWQRARDLSCSALLAGEMCVVVTGLPGTGKSMLVQTVARALRSTGWNIALYTARLPSNAEFATLTGSAAILIDDAERLSATELRTLNRLRQCSVLLAGAIGLEKRCPADSRVTLTPLPLDEVATYVELWLEQAGLSPDLVGEDALAHLTDVSGGIVRVLDILLADSLKGARADRSDQIEEHHIDHAAWRHVEHTAARRLSRAAASPPAAAPKSVKHTPALSEADWEQRLAQAPFADPSAVDRPGSLVSTRALGLACFGLGVGLAAGAGLMTWPQWSPWALTTYSSIVPKRDAPVASIGTLGGTPIVPATPSSPEPVAAASVAAAVESPRPAEVQSVPTTAIVPPAEPAPAQAPPDPVPPVMAASSQPSPAIADARPAPSTPPDATRVESALPSTAASEPLSPTIIRLLNQRGQQMIDLNDYSAARLLFSRAAESGSVKAMLSLGRSYDPSFNGSPAPVTDPDPAQAAQWYRKAAALGSSDAAILLQQLERGPRE